MDIYIPYELSASRSSISATEGKQKIHHDILMGWKLLASGRERESRSGRAAGQTSIGRAEMKCLWGSERTRSLASCMTIMREDGNGQKVLLVSVHGDRIQDHADQSSDHLHARP